MKLYAKRAVFGIKPGDEVEAVKISYDMCALIWNNYLHMWKWESLQAFSPYPIRTEDEAERSKDDGNQTLPVLQK